VMGTRLIGGAAEQFMGVLVCDAFVGLMTHVGHLGTHHVGRRTSGLWSGARNEKEANGESAERYGLRPHFKLLVSETPVPSLFSGRHEIDIFLQTAQSTRGRGVRPGHALQVHKTHNNNEIEKYK